MRLSTTLQRHRCGFTIIELLIVLAIIGIITALTLGAMMLIPERARARGTEATIAKVDAALENRINAFNQRSKNIRPTAADRTLANQNGPIARVIAVIREYRQEFPEWFTIDPGLTNDGLDNDADGIPDEADEIVYAQWNPVDIGPNNTPGIPMTSGAPDTLADQLASDIPTAAVSYKQYIGRVINENSNNATKDLTFHVPGTARSECLYMILTQVGSPVSFDPQEIADTDNDGLMEIVDRWGNPIQFFLFPTNYDSGIQNPGSEVDPFDPNRLLSSSAWWQIPDPIPPISMGDNTTVFERLFHVISGWSSPLLVYPDANAPPSIPGGDIPMSYKTYPLILSAGADGGLSLISETDRLGTDGAMGTLDDEADNYSTPGVPWDDLPPINSRAMKITNDDFDGFGMDGDNIDNHSLRVR